jgi:hypothetical protein
MRPDAARFMRPDAQRYIRPDVARFLRPGTLAVDVFPALNVKYRPTQRRVPAGETGGGRWADEAQQSTPASGLVTGVTSSLISGIVQGIIGGVGGIAAGAIGALGSSATEATSTDASTADDAVLAFDTADSADPWADLIGGDGTAPRQIPNADPEDIPANLDEVAARRGNSPNPYFPGATTQQLVRMDQAASRSATAIEQVRQYQPSWRPSEAQATMPGSIEGAIARAEARAAEAETRLDQLRFGPGGNRGPSLLPELRPTTQPTRTFDGGTWIDTYRTINNAPDLFGEASWPTDKGTVAAGTSEGKLFIGVNSTAPGYTKLDWNNAADLRDDLIAKYPAIMSIGDIGRMPNDALFHAEATILIRAARDAGGSLTDRSIEITIDRELCRSCGTVLPKLSMELGNPYVTFIERGTGMRHEMWYGQWLTGRFR